MWAPAQDAVNDHVAKPVGQGRVVLSHDVVAMTEYRGPYLH